MATESSDGDHSNDSIFRRLESYSFSADSEFQSGLSTILSTTPSQDAEPLTLRARCFYFSRKQSVPIDFNSYISWRSAQNLPPITTALEETPHFEPQINGIAADANDTDTTAQLELGEQPQAPYPSSFAQIVELITKGEPIPGLREVPDTLLIGQESEATTTKRKKPWEKDEVVAEAQEAESGGHG